MSAVDSRWTTALRRLFLWHQTPEVADVLAPVMDVGGRALELHLVRGERLFQTVSETIAAGGAGQFGRAQFVNPADSNRVVVISKVIAEKTTAPGAIVAFATQRIVAGWAGALALRMFPRDTGWALPVGSTPLTSPYTLNTGSNAVSFSAPADFLQVAALGTKQTFDVAYVLRPGGALVLGNTSANEAFTLCFHGYDVPLTGPEHLLD